MQLLSPAQRAQLASRFLPERPGPMVGLHVLETGHGAVFGDRWPQPRALLSASGENYSLLGDTSAFSAADLVEFISGLLDAPPEFEPLLVSVDPLLGRWDRVISQLPGEAAHFDAGRTELRRLTHADTHHVFGMSESNDWISQTWGGPPSLCAGGLAWGAFVKAQLVSVAAPFYVGQRFEDIGVVTEPGFRGRGLSVACAGSLCADIRTRGRTPSWSTSPDNTASLRVAEKLGFEHERDDLLYVVRAGVPEPAEPPN
jgi:GNAT superfamily N-acetyltransferase